MEKEEWKVLAKTLRTFYTQSNFLPDLESVQAWFFLLKDLPTADVKNAVMEYTLTNKFPPTIADIREKATKVELDDWSVGWEKVLKAVSKYGYVNEQGALDSLDEITKECVKRMGWKNICQSENADIERANFRGIYQTISQELQKGQTLKGLYGDTRKEVLCDRNILGIE